MATIEIDYTPRYKQQLFHASTADELLFGGAKSPGKSCALTMEAVGYALEFPGSQPHLFRESYDDLEANLIQEFKDRVPEKTPDGQVIYRYLETKHNAEFFNGSVIKFRHVSCLKDAQAYQGRSIPWVGIDELTKHDEKTVQELLSCNRSSKGYPVRARFTSNPGGLGHAWVKERFITKTDYGKKTYVDEATKNTIEFIPATVYDGVLVETDPGYVSRLENLGESEKQAYLYGNWDIFEGQFFSGYFGDHNRCRPFIIPEQEDNSCVFASLDHGIVHDTSFGLYWLASDGSIYRIFTYARNGNTTRFHAEAIAEVIESCRFSRYLPPTAVYYDYAMNKEHRLNKEEYRSDIDEYKDVFKDLGWNTRFVSANKRKIDGCSMLKTVFSADTDGSGFPIFRYFDGLNDELEASVNLVMTDKLNPEIYAKMEGDDTADEVRYGVMGIVSKNIAKQNKNKKGSNFRVPANGSLLNYRGLR